MRISSKGQVTIPIRIREQLGLLPNTEVSWEPREDGVLLRKAHRLLSTRGQLVLDRLRGSATVKMTTDEIMALTRGDD